MRVTKRNMRKEAALLRRIEREAEAEIQAAKRGEYREEIRQETVRRGA